MKPSSIELERRRRELNDETLGVELRRDGTIRVERWLADLLAEGGTQWRAMRSWSRYFKRASRIARRLAREHGLHPVRLTKP